MFGGNEPILGIPPMKRDRFLLGDLLTTLEYVGNSKPVTNYIP